MLRVPSDLAHAIAIGIFPLSLAELVAEVQPESARIGLAQFILANVAHVTVEGVRECVTRLKGWDQFRTMPMTVAQHDSHTCDPLATHACRRCEPRLE